MSYWNFHDLENVVASIGFENGTAALSSKFKEWLSQPLKIGFKNQTQTPPLTDDAAILAKSMSTELTLDTDYCRDLLERAQQPVLYFENSEYTLLHETSAGLSVLERAIRLVYLDRYRVLSALRSLIRTAGEGAAAASIIDMLNSMRSDSDSYVSTVIESIRTLTVHAQQLPPKAHEALVLPDAAKSSVFVHYRSMKDRAVLIDCLILLSTIPGKQFNLTELQKLIQLVEDCSSCIDSLRSQSQRHSLDVVTQQLMLCAICYANNMDASEYTSEATTGVDPWEHRHAQALCELAYATISSAPQPISNAIQHQGLQYLGGIIASPEFRQWKFSHFAIKPIHDAIFVCLSKLTESSIAEPPVQPSTLLLTDGQVSHLFRQEPGDYFEDCIRVQIELLRIDPELAAEYLHIQEADNADSSAQRISPTDVIDRALTDISKLALCLDFYAALAACQSCTSEVFERFHQDHLEGGRPNYHLISLFESIASELRQDNEQAWTPSDDEQRIMLSLCRLVLALCHNPEVSARFSQLYIQTMTSQFPCSVDNLLFQMLSLPVCKELKGLILQCLAQMCINGDIGVAQTFWRHMHLWNILVPGGPCVVNEMDAEMLSGEYPITYGYLQLLRSIVRKGILPKTYLSFDPRANPTTLYHHSDHVITRILLQASSIQYSEIANANGQQWALSAQALGLVADVLQQYRVFPAQSVSQFPHQDSAGRREMTQHFEPGDMIADFQRTAELSQQRKRSLGYEYMMRLLTGDGLFDCVLDVLFQNTDTAAGLIEVSDPASIGCRALQRLRLDAEHRATGCQLTAQQQAELQLQQHSPSDTSQSQSILPLTDAVELGTDKPRTSQNHIRVAKQLISLFLNGKVADEVKWREKAVLTALHILDLALRLETPFIDAITESEHGERFESISSRLVHRRHALEQLLQYIGYSGDSRIGLTATRVVCSVLLNEYRASDTEISNAVTEATHARRAIVAALLASRCTDVEDVALPLVSSNPNVCQTWKPAEQTIVLDVNFGCNAAQFLGQVTDCADAFDDSVVVSLRRHYVLQMLLACMTASTSEDGTDIISVTLIHRLIGLDSLIEESAAFGESELPSSSIVSTIATGLLAFDNASQAYPFNSNHTHPFTAQTHPLTASVALELLLSAQKLSKAFAPTTNFLMRHLSTEPQSFYIRLLRSFMRECVRAGGITTPRLYTMQLTAESQFEEYGYEEVSSVIADTHDASWRLNVDRVYRARLLTQIVNGLALELCGASQQDNPQGFQIESILRYLLSSSSLIEDGVEGAPSPIVQLLHCVKFIADIMPERTESMDEVLQRYQATVGDAESNTLDWLDGFSGTRLLGDVELRLYDMRVLNQQPSQYVPDTQVGAQALMVHSAPGEATHIAEVLEQTKRWCQRCNAYLEDLTSNFHLLQAIRSLVCLIYGKLHDLNTIIEVADSSDMTSVLFCLIDLLLLQISPARMTDKDFHEPVTEMLALLIPRACDSGADDHSMQRWLKQLMSALARNVASTSTQRECLYTALIAIINSAKRNMEPQNADHVLRELIEHGDILMLQITKDMSTYSTSMLRVSVSLLMACLEFDVHKQWLHKCIQKGTIHELMQHLATVDSNEHEMTALASASAFSDPYYSLTRATNFALQTKSIAFSLRERDPELFVEFVAVQEVYAIILQALLQLCLLTAAEVKQLVQRAQRTAQLSMSHAINRAYNLRNSCLVSTQLAPRLTQLRWFERLHQNDTILCPPPVKTEDHEMLERVSSPSDDAVAYDYDVNMCRLRTVLRLMAEISVNLDAESGRDQPTTADAAGVVDFLTAHSSLFNSFVNGIITEKSSSFCLHQLQVLVDLLTVVTACMHKFQPNGEELRSWDKRIQAILEKFKIHPASSELGGEIERRKVLEAIPRVNYHLHLQQAKSNIRTPVRADQAELVRNAFRISIVKCYEDVIMRCFLYANKHPNTYMFLRDVKDSTFKSAIESCASAYAFTKTLSAPTSQDQLDDRNNQSFAGFGSEDVREIALSYATDSSARLVRCLHLGCMAIAKAQRMQRMQSSSDSAKDTIHRFRITSHTLQSRMFSGETDNQLPSTLSFLLKEADFLLGTT